MKNYYEILEVDKKASQEVIEKAYKALAKKYHPDLQQGAKKQECAEKMKIINEAYEVLSDNFKRNAYDEKLKNEQLRNQGISREQQEKIIQENYQLKQQLNKMGNNVNKNNNTVDDGTIINMSRILNEQIKAATRQAYQDAYVNDMKNRGYKIKYKHDFKYYLKLIKVLAIMFVVAFLIYQIPFVKNFFTNLYKENIVFQALVDIFKNTFSTKF